MAPTIDQPVALRGDEDQLYRRHHRRLRSAVRLTVNTADDIIDDACSHAWIQLLRRQPRRDTVYAWLKTVAVREAIRLDRRQRRHVTTQLDELEHPALRDHRRDPGFEDELIDALDTLRSLSPRQRQVLGLHALGLRHTEIAQATGDTARTVARQMVLARRAVRAQSGKAR